MRFMVIVKADGDSEAGVMPTEKMLADMGRFNDELVKAGVMLAGEGLHPCSRGARLRFAGEKRTVIVGARRPAQWCGDRRISVPAPRAAVNGYCTTAAKLNRIGLVVIRRKGKTELA